MKKSMLVILAGVVLVSTAFGDTGKKAAGKVAAGQKSFMMHCAVCHGQNADGQSQMTSVFSTPIPDYRSPKVQALTDSEIADTIMNGKGQMPAVAGVDASEIPGLVAYVRSFAPKKKAKAAAK
jgi:mono/diheme cytochrome c family protein